MRILAARRGTLCRLFRRLCTDLGRSRQQLQRIHRAVSQVVEGQTNNLTVLVLEIHLDGKTGTSLRLGKIRLAFGGRHLPPRENQGDGQQQQHLNRIHCTRRKPPLSPQPCPPPRCPAWRSDSQDGSSRDAQHPPPPRLQATPPLKAHRKRRRAHLRPQARPSKVSRESRAPQAPL